MYGVSQIELQGEEHVHTALAAGGVMFTVNHPAHGDPFVVFEAMDRLRASCCYMAAWQVMEGWMGLKPWAFQRLGVFSVDREGTDMRSFRTAVDILAEGRHSLVIFPEGDVYHLNDRITPMREGAAMIAVTAAKRRQKRTSDAPLLLVPCALKYFYLESPQAELEEVMTRLEESIYWRTRSDCALVDRIINFAGAIVALKEQEYFGEPGSGSLTDRIAQMSEQVLSSIEQRRSGRISDATIPARVKQVRLDVLKSSGLAGADDDSAQESAAAVSLSADEAALAQRDLEDLHFVTQLFSYSGDYLTGDAPLERIAETLDKLEEDALGAEAAGARAPRRAILRFGESIDVSDFAASAGKTRRAAPLLTTEIERRMQAMLDHINAEARGETVN